MFADYFSRLRTYILPQSRVPVSYILVRVSTNTLLTVSTDVAIVSFLARTISDATYYSGVQYPNYLSSLFLLSIPTSEYPRWTWDTKTRTFVHTREDVLTDSIRELSRLATAKRDVISVIMRKLNATRLRMSTGLFFQEHIYLTKKAEAKAFAESGYDEDRLLEFPYLLQYLEFAKISPRQAADTILLKARLSADELAKTEFLRMKFFSKVREAKKPEELPAISEEFERDLYINATL